MPPLVASALSRTFKGAYCKTLASPATTLLVVDTAVGQDALYEQAAARYGAAIERLARGYEPDPERRRDLIQDIHVALWRSLAGFNGRCSLRTWVYRVAHNVVTSQILRRRDKSPALVSLDVLASMPDGHDGERAADRRLAIERLLALVQTLEPLDRRVILLYLEDVDAASIGEITGLSAGNVATKVHRIKQILSRRFHQGANHGA
jgi:RNA polymerase sigma-70 factor, ECF subfamily